MARRRFQSPKPFREGNWWWIAPWLDVFEGGKIERKRKRLQVAPATTSEKDARRIAAEMLRPINQGLESIGAATPFGVYVNETYRPTILPLLASTTKKNYECVLNRYLLPVFADYPLREMSTMTLQRYFSGLRVGHASAVKIRDALASVLTSAVRFQLLARTPLEGVQLPPDRSGKRTKPTITPVLFEQLISLMAEPYATMVYVCVLSGLRVSELIGLKWDDVHEDALTIDERFCRGDWGPPKTTGSNATIGVAQCVIKRIHQLKDVEVTINWGAHGARKTFRTVRASGPCDLVFQSLRKGGPMSDHNILSRHLKPAARKLGIGFVNWQVLRRSYGTWMVQAGADPKSVQAQMRHARISTTMDIYAQVVAEAQRKAVEKMMAMVSASVQAEAVQ